MAEQEIAEQPVNPVDPVEEERTLNWEVDIAADIPAAPPKKGAWRLIAELIAVLVILGLGVGWTMSHIHLSRLSSRETALAETVASQNETIASLEAECNTQKSQLDTLRSEITKKNAQLDALRRGTGPKVALTFDDGPGPYTAQLLDILKERHAKATFFLIGRNAARYPELIRRMEAEGHAIGNHTYNHTVLTKVSEEKALQEMQACNDVIRRTVGHDAVMLRTPTGSSNAAVRGYAAQLNLPIAFWSVDTRDWQSRDVNKILQVAFGAKGIKDGSIVLMHDIYQTSVDAVAQMLDRLSEDGYTFLTVPELLEERRGGMQPGQVYVSAYPE